jgi:predicted O-methyltransferase YrrM
MNIIDKDIEAYIEDMSSEEDYVLSKIYRETYVNQVNPRMVSGAIQGKLLGFLSEMIKPEYILEVGTFTAYSTICLARGLSEKGKITTIEKNPELEVWIKRNIELAGLENKVELIIGDAIDVLPSLNDIYDIVFIDADKVNYPAYFDIVLPKLKSGGIIFADNVLWNGKVLDSDKYDDKDTMSIIEFNKKVKNCEEVDNIIIPLRDGLSLIRKK